MSTVDLPVFPVKGQRRTLDAHWLAVLHREGLSPYVGAISEQPKELEVAIEEFNGGDYWRCHETLEHVWLSQEYPMRLFYHGLLKAAVGLLHLERHNRRGAAAKLEDAHYTLGPFAPRCMQVDTRQLLEDVDARLTYLHIDGDVDWQSVDELPRVQLVTA